jgi:hypothetical protein
MGQRMLGDLGAQVGDFAAGQSQAAGKPAAPKIAAPNVAADQMQQERSAAKSIDEDRAGQVYRYQQRLEQSAPQTAAGSQPGDALRKSLTDPFGGETSGAAAGSGGMGGAWDYRGDKSRESFDGLPSGGYGMTKLGGALNTPLPPGASAAESPLALQLGAGGASEGAQPPGLDGTIDTYGRGVAPPTGYLASLDVELPVRGVEYLFTTPRGETEITAQSISKESIQRLSMIAGLLVAALCVWLLSRIYTRTRAVRSWTARLLAGTLALVLAGVLLLTGTTPLYAVLALAAAVAIFVRPAAPSPALT